MRAAKIAGVLMSLTLSATALAETPSYGQQLEGFEYPHPLLKFPFESQASLWKWATWMSNPPARPMAALRC